MPRVLAAFAAIVLPLGGCASAPSPRSAPSAIQADLTAALAAQDAAIIARDAEAFVATLAPDYVVVLRDGTTLTRPGIDRAIRADMAATKSVARSTARIDMLEPAGPDKVVARVVHEASRVLTDGAGVDHRWDNGVVHRETWARTAAGWRIVRLEEQEQLYLRKDGVAR